VPTTQQRLLAGVPPARFHDYVETERHEGRRYLGRMGAAEWVASFAPLGPGELRAFLFGISSPELDADTVSDLGRGVATALGLYTEMGFESFNMALYGGAPGSPEHPLNLRIMCRSNPQPFYRSDATHLERLHWESAVDLWPEEITDAAGDRFRD
jgi:galactose-1-phosphate uridylyltransferase